MQALPGETAEFELTPSLVYPMYAKGELKDLCSRFTSACGRDSARAAWNASGPPAPPPSAAAAEMLSALERGAMSFSKLTAMMWDGAVRKVLPIALMVSIVLGVSWCFRTWRTRRRRKYRMPHDNW